MARKESDRTAAAVTDVLAGMTKGDAATKHDVNLEALRRALRRRGVGPLKRGRRPRPLAALPEPFYLDGEPLVTP